MSAKTNLRQELFAKEYVIDLNATRAAISAGYSESTASEIGSKLLRNNKVKRRIEALIAKRLSKLEISGDKVLEQLITRWPGLCVIIITGYPSLEDMRTTFKLKVFDYLAKPFSLTQLRQVLKNAVVAFGLGKSPQDRLRERLGHSIKMLRVERDWSLKDLATQTKLSVSQISAIERGTNLPSIESLLAISKAFDKKPSEILQGIDF